VQRPLTAPEEAPRAVGLVPSPGRWEPRPSGGQTQTYSRGMPPREYYGAVCASAAANILWMSPELAC
jgi:hypothetical protein